MNFSKTINFYDLELKPGDYLVDEDNAWFKVQPNGTFINEKTNEVVPDLNINAYWNRTI